jgi:hypothetical protein
MNRGCVDCGEEVFDYYMVWDWVWRRAGFQKKKRGAHCCLACLERRLKRPLTLEDFIPAPVNRLAYAGAGLL